MVTVVGSY